MQQRQSFKHVHRLVRAVGEGVGWQPYWVYNDLYKKSGNRRISYQGGLWGMNTQTRAKLLSGVRSVLSRTLDVPFEVYYHKDTQGVDRLCVRIPKVK